MAVLPAPDQVEYYLWGLIGMEIPEQWSWIDWGNKDYALRAGRDGSQGIGAGKEIRTVS